MPGEMPAGRFRVTMEQFHALRDERPKEEKWELIDGVPVMMPPPLLVHQRISSNVKDLLNAQLANAKPQWRADMEIGVLLPDDDRFNPEPDVTVIDADIEMGQLFATRFYFVAEVLSPSDRPHVLTAKLGYYQAHPNCVGVIFVRQDRIEAELHGRTDGWQVRKLQRRNDRIDIPVIGDIGPLEALYQHTPLFNQ